MQQISMAWRNLWRNRRRTLVTATAMAVGLFVMIGYSGLMSGYLLDMERQIVDVEIGDLQIHAPGYRDDPSLYTRLEGVDALLQKLDAAGFAASPRLIGAGLVAAKDNSSGGQLIGVDVARDAKVGSISSRVAKGRWLRSDGDNEVVLGRWLAEALEVSVGDEIVLLSQGADGSTANELYTVCGIFGQVGGGVDRGGVFMTLAAFRELMVVPQGAHRIMVRFPPAMTPAAGLAAVRALAPDVDVEGWRGLVPTLGQMLDSAKAAMSMMFLIIFVAVGILLLNTMLMAVFERIREFGILKAIGFSPGAVLSLVLLESAMQTAMAIATAVLLSLPTMWWLTEYGFQIGSIELQGISSREVWRAAPTLSTWTTPTAVLIGVVIVAVAYPAMKAAFIRPIDAIRHS